MSIEGRHRAFRTLTDALDISQPESLGAQPSQFSGKPQPTVNTVTGGTDAKVDTSYVDPAWSESDMAFLDRQLPQVHQAAAQALAPTLTPVETSLVRRAAITIAQPANASRNAVSRVAQLSPQGLRLARQMATIRQIVKPEGIRWVKGYGVDKIASSVGTGFVPTMQARAAGNVIALSGRAQQQVIPFINLGLAMDGPLGAIDQLLGAAPGPGFGWVGEFIDISVPAIQSEVNRPFTVTITFTDGTTQTITSKVKEAGTKISFSVLHGRIFNGETALFRDELEPGAAAPTGAGILVTGLNPATYSASMRFIVPGDVDADALAEQLA